jgi:hypothetical protein
MRAQDLWQEKADGRSRMAASAQTHRFELLRATDRHPKDIARRVILSTSSLIIAKE